MVEVMMALAVLAVGAVGVISLQNVAVMSGLASRNLTSATNAAASWIERAQGEAAQWRDPQNNDITAPAALVTMPVLATAVQAPGTWVDLPASVATGRTAVDGSPATAANIAYCSQVRATFLGAAGTADLVSFQVRTYFARNGRLLDSSSECFAGGAAAMSAALATSPFIFTATPQRTRDEYGFVYMAGTVRRNTQ